MDFAGTEILRNWCLPSSIPDIPNIATDFFKWCIRTQLPDGSWFQRYWLNGDIAPSWGNFDYSTQIDETGSTLHAMDVYYRILEGLKKSRVSGRSMGLSTQGCRVSDEADQIRLARKLYGSVGDLLRNLHVHQFLYICRLMGASHLAEENGESGMARRWKKAEFIKQATIDRFWLQEGYFAKGIIHEKLDKTLDASVLGAYIPFG
ncbi:glycoside hydrolase family 15 protein [Methanosarcina horonobensis]|uniref:hypothetical protein n=1 Tax=Methanosarcina horonobensis TaxID=418008 RepID=UPI0022B8E39E|nr:hypothetical protein [Methanosarcina horonobensis]